MITESTIKSTTHIHLITTYLTLSQTLKIIDGAVIHQALQHTTAR